MIETLQHLTLGNILSFCGVLVSMGFAYGIVKTKMGVYDEKFEKNDKAHERMVEVLDKHTRCLTAVETKQTSALEILKYMKNNAKKRNGD